MSNSLVIAIVLYQTEFAQTPSYSLLRKFLATEKSMHLFVYDNSPKAQEDMLFHEHNVHYFHDETNLGLAVAYNAAKDFCIEVQGDLLLLLDQDTTIKASYIEKLLGLTVTIDIGAYVPIVQSHGRQISPVLSEHYIGRSSTFPEAGIYTEKIMSINSGTALPKETLRLLRTFNLEFPLDFLDHWLFWQLHRLQKKICVLDEHVDHELSVLDYSAVSLKRYESIIQAESLFYQKYEHDKFTEHKKHLLLRTIKQFLRVKNRAIWRRTFSEYRKLSKGK
ncbi:glycosyltransferase [Enterococcus wangshanyuanii]|uniref:Glycosyl transferase family 2 n=1 Tax=Enterococcus wangshanyuanii TaxID=2005703 RepID=A0ABQ1PLH8_9ENTE|nr:glycosyltransferase [Enterococcus wangshanyuanii]GGC99083.1 glycosyl transferase family 2 [Enterococcus wangshanyuanii]